MTLMPSSYTIEAIKWAITLSGVIVLIFSIFGWRAAIQERHGLKHIGHNGSLAAAAQLHLIVSSTRLLAALIAIGIGLVLILFDDTFGGMLAGLGLFLWNLILTFNLMMELRTRALMRNAVTYHEVLTQLDETVSNRVERTAERLERAAERLERTSERTERAEERKERAVERAERGKI